MSNVYVYNLKTDSRESLDTNTALTSLLTKDSGIIPLENNEYVLTNQETGADEKVLGRDFYRFINNGNYTLKHGALESKIRPAVKEKYSKAGMFARGALNEAFTLGIVNTFREMEDSPNGKIISDVAKEEFGNSYMAGQIGGFVGSIFTGAPLKVASLTGKLISKGVKPLVKPLQILSKSKAGKQALAQANKIASTQRGQALIKAGRYAKELASNTPLGVALRGLSKVYEYGGNKAVELAVKYGIKSQTALKTIRSAGYASAGVAVSPLFAAPSIIQEGIYTPKRQPTSDEDIIDPTFNIRAAFNHGKKAVPEMFTLSMMFESALFGGVVAGRGILGTRKYISRKGLQPALQTLSQKLRRSFFGLSESPEKLAMLKKNVAKAPDQILKNLTDHEVIQIYNNISDAGKARLGLKGSDAKMLRGNFKHILKHIDEGDLVNILAKNSQVLNNNKPVGTRDDYYKLFEKELVISGRRLEELRLVPTIELAKDQKNIVKLDRLTLSDIDKVKGLLAATPKVKDQMKKMGRGINALLYDGLAKGLVKKYATHSKKQMFALTKNKKVILDEISEKATELGLKKLNVIDKDRIFREFSQYVESNPEAFSILADQQVFQVLTDQLKSTKRLSVRQANRLLETADTVFNMKDPLLNKTVRKLKNIRRDLYEDIFIDKGLYFTSNELLKFMNGVKRKLNVFEKHFSKGQIVSSLEKIKYILDGYKKRGHKISFVHFNEMNTEFKRLAFASKDKLTSRLTPVEKDFRKIAAQLSDIETSRAFELQATGRLNKIIPNFGDELIDLKQKYSLVNTQLSLMEDIISSDKKFMFSNRDMLLQIFGVFGGAAIFSSVPIVGGVLGGSAMYTAALIHKHGWQFQRTANILESFSNHMKQSKDIYDFQNRSINKILVQRNLKKITKGKPEIHNITADEKPSYKENVNYLKIYGLMKTNEEKSEPKNFEQFANDLKTSDPKEILLSNNQQYYKIIDDIGGSEVANQSQNKLMDVKQMILQDLPEGTFDPIKQKNTYTKTDEFMFYDKINRYLNPEKFVFDFVNGTLTNDQLNKFTYIYPELKNKLVLHILEKIKTKKIIMTNGIKQSLDMLSGKDSSSFMLQLDVQNKIKEQEQMQNQRSGGVRFSTLAQPSQEQRARQFGGAIQ